MVEETEYERRKKAADRVLELHPRPNRMNKRTKRAQEKYRQKMKGKKDWTTHGEDGKPYKPLPKNPPLSYNPLTDD